MKEESTPYARYEPAQTISVLLYSFHLPDFDYKNSVVCTRTQVRSGLACKTGFTWHKSKLSALVCTVFRDPWKERLKRCRPLFSQSNSKFKEIPLKCQRNHELFCGFLCFYAKLSSPHPALSTIRGVVQSLTGVGKQAVALVLQVEEVAVGSIHTAGRETAGGVGGDIETTGSGGQDLTAYKEQVTKCAVRGVRAAGNPGTATVAGTLDGVVAWVDADELSA